MHLNSGYLTKELGLFILGNQNPPPCDQKEAFSHESAPYSPSSDVELGRIESYGGIALMQVKGLDDQWWRSPQPGMARVQRLAACRDLIY